MKYVIYELIKPEHLEKTVRVGYDIKTICRNVLEKIDVEDVEAEHDTLELALAEIESKKDKLKYCELTIIPLIYITD